MTDLHALDLHAGDFHWCTADPGDFGGPGLRSALLAQALGQPAHDDPSPV